jgi:hypothetical protein
MEYLPPPKVWKIQIPGRPNQGMPKTWGWAASLNTSYSSSRDGPPFVPRFRLYLPPTKVPVCIINELKYS